MRYSWDPQKAEQVFRDRGISFEEASSACEDPNAQWMDDLEHGEVRLKVIGYSRESRLLTVVCLEIDEAGEELRIITAWHATAAERETYEDP